MHPPPPNTGSMITPARFFEYFFNIFNEFSKSLYGIETIFSSLTTPLLSDSLNGQLTLFSKSDVYPCHPPSIFAIIFLPVTERANLTAYIVASVPDVTYLIFSATGTAFEINSDNFIVCSFTVPYIQLFSICFLIDSLTFF